RISSEILAPGKIDKELAAMEAALEKQLASDKAAADARGESTGRGGMFGPPSLSLAEFIAKRQQSIDDQLAGKSDGYVPAQGFGGGGFGRGGMGPPGGQPRGFGPPGATQAARPLFNELDANRDGKLTEDEIVS